MVAAGIAQERSPTQFRTLTDISRLEVTVLDRRTRKPVTGLTAEDFIVKVGGDVQRIAAIAEVSADTSAAKTSDAFRQAAFDVAENTRQGQRLIVIIMNDAIGTNDPFERKTGKEIARRVIDSLGPNDLAAVVFVRDNRPAQDFTADRSLLLTAIETFNPMASVYAAPVLSNVVRFLSEVPGHRRSVIYISATGGLAAKQLSRLTDVAGFVDDGTLPVTSADVVSLGTARGTSASHIPIYLFHTAGLVAPNREDIASGRTRRELDWGAEDAFRSVAAMTGGRAVYATNTPAQEVPAVFEELASYYVLGFERSYPLDGKLRWLQVEVRRPDLLVFPSNVPLGTPREALWNPTGESNLPRLPALVQALAGALPTGVIPLKLATVALPSPGQRNHSVIAVLGLPPLPAGTAREDYAVTVAVFDGEGRRELQRQQQTVTLNAGSSTTRGIVDVPLSLSLPAGRYNLRAAVERSSTQAAGSVYATVVIPDFARDPLSLSGVAIGDRRSPLASGSPFARMLPFAPTVERTFTGIDPDERAPDRVSDDATAAGGGGTPERDSARRRDGHAP